jgi:hypothetical protein
MLICYKLTNEGTHTFDLTPIMEDIAYILLLLSIKIITVEAKWGLENRE